MTVTRGNFKAALDSLVSIEPNPNAVQSMAHYDALMAPHQAAITQAKATIHDYGLQIAHKGLPFMQDELQFFLGQQTDSLALSVIKSTVNQSWNGCGQWQA